jgi:hypothetical protein
VGYPPEAIEMIRQMKATNYLPKMFVHNGVSQEDFLKATGKDAEYAFGMSLYEPSLPTKGNADFVRRFKAKYNYEPGYYAALGYAGCLVLEEAVKKTGSLDQDKLAATLRSLQTETAFGPYAVSETGAQTAKKGSSSRCSRATARSCSRSPRRRPTRCCRCRPGTSAVSEPFSGAGSSRADEIPIVRGVDLPSGGGGHVYHRANAPASPPRSRRSWVSSAHGRARSS